VDEEPRARRLEAAGADLVIPALALAFALYFFWSITGLAWEASANGVVIGTVLLLLIGIQLVRIGLKVRSGQATLHLMFVVFLGARLPAGVIERLIQTATGGGS
jgi:hypothetical protein